MKKVEQKNEVQDTATDNKEPNALVITIKLAEAIKCPNIATIKQKLRLCECCYFCVSVCVSLSCIKI